MKLKNRSKVILTVVCVFAVAAYLFMAAYSEKATYIINDATLADNDTIVSGWVDIGGASNVALYQEASDSVWARSTVYYRFGTGGQRVALAAIDTISTKGNLLGTWTTASKDLRGYATHVWASAVGMADTNYIPGANQIYVKTTIADVGGASTATTQRVRVGLIISE